jgi:hypothetical protein
LIKRFTAAAAGAALAAICLAPAFAQTSPMPMSAGSSMSAAMTGPDHGMPEGTAGGDGVSYTGAPDLQAAISLVTAGGAPGHFSLVKALTALAGAKTANAEVAKLTKQYGQAKVASFVAVQNFAVNDAVAVATKAGVKFPAPTVHGTALAVRVVKLGLVDGTYYEGVQLDHLVTNKIHETVMGHIDGKFGVAADANYHRIANQAHYDLAQALGAKTVKLAAFH